MMLDWILQKANIPRELIAGKRFQRIGSRHENLVDKAKTVFTEPAPNIILDQYMKNNKINFAVGLIVWHEYYSRGRWTESPFAQEARAILNTLWQVCKNDLGLGTQWIESEQGAYLHLATSSIRSKRDHMPLIQIIMDGNSQNRGDPTCWVFHTSRVSVQGQEHRFFKKFNAMWSEGTKAALENHRKRVEQQRALHSDPLIPNLSQLAPHTIFKEIRPLAIGTSNSEPWGTSTTHTPNSGTKPYCGLKRNNPKTTRKEKESPKDRESQQKPTRQRPKARTLPHRTQRKSEGKRQGRLRLRSLEEPMPSLQRQMELEPGIWRSFTLWVAGLE